MSYDSPRGQQDNVIGIEFGPDAVHLTKAVIEVEAEGDSSGDVADSFPTFTVYNIIVVLQKCCTIIVLRSNT